MEQVGKFTIRVEWADPGPVAKQRWANQIKVLAARLRAESRRERKEAA